MKKQWIKPNVSNLTLEKTMSGTCPAKAKHVSGGATCPNYCTVCGGCGANASGNASDDVMLNCPYYQAENIHRCICNGAVIS